MSNEKQKWEQEYLKDELYIETFQKSDEDFSSDRVEGLVRLLEANEPTDPDEIEESQRAFEAILKKKMVRKPAYRIKKFAQAVAILCLVLIGANITTEAFMSESLFRMIQSCSNKYEIIPGDTEIEHQESDTKIFSSIDDFDVAFEEDFLICSWLPEGYELDSIFYAGSEELCNYVWSYSNHKDSEINIQIYNKVNNNIASLIGTDFTDEELLDLKNGISGTLSTNNDEYLCCFEYNDWWYLIYSADRDMLISVVEGMEEYE